MQKLNTYPIEILLIESIPQNIELVTRMLNMTKFRYQLHIANNVSEIDGYLNQEDVSKNKPKPDIILLHPDPVSDFEKEIIKETHSNESFSHIPVLIMQIANNKIEITKVINTQHNYVPTNKLDIKYFLETIISLKKFMGSLVKPSVREIKVVPKTRPSTEATDSRSLGEGC